jgi:hypothetical protein
MPVKRNPKREKSAKANFEKYSTVYQKYLDFIIDDKDCGIWRARIRDLVGEYQGGEYIVELWAPIDYPFGPPVFYFKTPNGVYECDKKVCISTGEFHKENYVAANGGMGGFSLDLVNGLICWQELGTGIAIMHSEFQMAPPAIRAQMLPQLLAEKRKYAAGSRAFNERYHADLVREFDELPFNSAIRYLDENVAQFNTACLHYIRGYIGLN